MVKPASRWLPDSANPLTRKLASSNQGHCLQRVFGFEKHGGLLKCKPTLWYFVLVCDIENGPVEIVDFPSYKMVDLSIVM